MIGIIGGGMGGLFSARLLALAGHSVTVFEPDPSPAGLDVGSDGAEEVATAIVAEILAVLRGRSGLPLRQRGGPIHG